MKNRLARLRMLAFAAMTVLATVACGEGPVEPSLLEFGNAREALSPLELSFDVVNPSDKDITVVGIETGCGCTMIDLPDPVMVKAGARHSFPVSIRLHGKAGEFSSQVSISRCQSHSVEFGPG